MSCLALTSTQWVASSTVEASTTLITSTTTFTNYPQPTETSIVQSWCAAAEKASTASAVPPSATSPSTEQRFTSNSTLVPSEQKGISTNSSGSISQTSSQSDTSSTKTTTSPLLQISRSVAREERKVPSASSSFTSSSPVKTTTASPPISATESKATPNFPRVVARQTAENDCSWTTQTHWTTFQPSAAVITSEVVATSTVWNTVETWVPSEIVQECPQTTSTTAVSSFFTGSSGWILPSSDGVAGNFTLSKATVALTWTDAPTKYTALPVSTTTPTNISVTTTSNNDAQTSSTSAPAVSLITASHVNEITNAATKPTDASAAAAAAENSTSRKSSVSAKAGWACGTIGILILLGLLVWFYLHRRKRSKREVESRGASPRYGEKASFLHGFEGVKGDGLDTATDGFQQVPLITLDGPDFPPIHPKPRQLASRFSANSSLQNIFGMSGPVAKALSQPLAYFGQTAANKRPVYPTNFIHPPPPMPDQPPAPYPFHMPRNQPGLSVQPPGQSQEPKENLVASKDHNPSNNRSYHYRRFSDTIKPYYRRFSEVRSSGEIGSLRTSSIKEETHSDQRPTALSPTTKNLLAEAMSLPMDGERSRRGPFMQSIAPEQHFLSVASGSLYSEPEIESFPDQRKSGQSGWYSKSIFKGMFPNGSDRPA